jgi:hypothetical protein
MCDFHARYPGNVYQFIPLGCGKFIILEESREDRSPPNVGS